MKIKFGSIIVDARNKIGGHVASKNRFGSYIRTKVTPTNPRSVSQLETRNRFASLSAQFRSLTDTEIAAWNDAAKLYQKTDIFGDMKANTGLQLFVGINYNRLLTSQAVLTTPPQPKAADIVFATNLVANNSSNSLTLTLSGNVPANSYAVIAATPAQSPGKNFVQTELRIITVKSPSTTSPIDLSSAYNNKFGAIGAVGQKIFVSLWFVDKDTGVMSQKQKISTIIVT